MSANTPVQTIGQLSNLGNPVTVRTISWNDLCIRAWGSEFNAPDHKIYQMSGGNNKDSTDQGTTGIYGGGYASRILFDQPSNVRWPDVAPSRILTESFSVLVSG